MKKRTQFKKEKNIIAAVLTAALIFLFSGVLMGLWSAGEMKEQVVAQFNEEQLVIARGLSKVIEGEVNLFKKELLFLRNEISKEMDNPEELDETIMNDLSHVLDKGVSSMDIFDSKEGIKHVYMLSGKFSVEVDPDENLPDIIPAKDINPDTIWISRPLVKPSGLSMMLAIPQIGASYRFIIFNIDLTWFLKPIFKEVRSGKTGYAWVIDQWGIFLFHPETDFIGRNAFKVREERAPEVSYSMINYIQEEEMIKGQEGTGFYFSGWHRGITGKIKKMISFSPVKISVDPSQIWSIAVVAPVSEIEGAVRSGYYRQFLLQSLTMGAVILGAFTIIFFEKRWLRRLEKKVEQRTRELSKSRENYRSLVESAEDFIFTVDSKGIFKSMNSFTANFFGGTPEDFIGKDLSVLFSNEIAEKQLEIIDMVFRLGKSVRDEFELHIGEYQIWINCNFMPLKDEEGNVTAILCIARDITQNKELEKHMINTEKLASMGTLAAGVAHEINNPLGVILGFCDLLLRKTDKESQEYEDLKTIERHGLHCKQVVENLLSFARLGEGEDEFSDLNQCLEEIIQVVSHTLEMKEIRLVLDLLEKSPLVEGDSRELQQVFLNLINNAISSMENTGGTLTIRTRLDGDNRAIVQIKDEGTGIKKEDMDHIFEPFFTTKAEGEGTGLGLFVSYGIVKKCGGSIDCISYTEDSSIGPRGTTFTIKLNTIKGGVLIK